MVNGAIMANAEYRCHPGGYGKIKLMAVADGYCMVRKPGCLPYVMSVKEWQRLPAFDPAIGNVLLQRDELSDQKQ